MVRVRPAMKLSTFTDYSLRMLMYLAAEPQRRATIAEIATAFGISEHHLSKVAHGLGRDGWLANVRGKGGGLALAMAAAAHRHRRRWCACTEGADLPAACFADDGDACAIGAVCRLRGVLGEAVQAFYARARPLHAGRPGPQPALRCRACCSSTRPARAADEPAARSVAHMNNVIPIEEPLRRPQPAPPPGFALWQLGFRPFYLLASVFAALSIGAVGAAVRRLAGPALPGTGRCGMRTRCCSASRWR